MTEAPDPSGATARAVLAPDQQALADAVREIERHVATGGWDGPVRVFALVETARALATDPMLESQLPAEVVHAARLDPRHLTSVEQEDLPPAEDVESLLGALTWPPTVDGAAIVLERVVLPPAAEEAMPTDPVEAVAYLLGHPDREDVRMAVGAMRDGRSWCAVRTRSHDSDDAVGQGHDVVPGLIDAVRATLS
ncbi:MAG TPA: PPA1309 family protein [Cellulomonadaceae bacterium]|nr:PPA1309 family protein [Cellulomonadaceae bacterium]